MADPVADLYPGDLAPVAAPTTASPQDSYPGETSPGGTHDASKDGFLAKLRDYALSEPTELNQDKLAVQAGLTRTGASLLGAPMAGYNLTAGWVGDLYKRATGEDAPTWLIDKYKTATPEWFMGLAKQAGLTTDIPNPKDPAQRYIAAASGGAASGAPGGPEGLVAGTVGGVSSQAAQDLGANRWGQAAAGILGSLTPTGARAFLQRVLQINPETAAQNIANVEATGGKATLGTAAGPGTNAQVVENALSNVPGPAGVIRGAVARNNDAATQTINDMADNLNAPTSKNTAGTLVQDTLEQDTVPAIRAKVAAAYQARAAAVPAGTTVDVSNLLNTIAEEASKNPNFRQLLQTDPVFKEIYAKLQGGAGWTKTSIGGRPGWIKPDNTVSFTEPPAATKLSFGDADNLSQQVGQMVDQSYNRAATTNIVNGSLAQVNAQFRRDISATLDGIPGAKAADANAKTVYEQAEAQKAQLRGVLNSNQPEQAYDLLVSGAKDAEGRLDAVFRGLPSDQQNQVAATIMRRLGVAVPSKQGAAGEAWSSETFLSNWNKISDGSKSILLRNMPQEYRENLDQIAQYAENVRKGASVYGNPSGTGSKIAQLKGVTGALAAGGSAMAALSHFAIPHAAIAALGPYAGMYMTARVMTNPAAVKWLATATRVPPGSAPIIAAQLNRVAQSSNDPDVARLAAAFAGQQQQNGEQQ